MITNELIFMNLAPRDLLPGLRRVVVIVTLAVAAVGIYPGLTLLGQRPSPSSRVPEARRLPPKIELWAPDAFDGAGRSTAEYCVRYRVDATVLFPLFSIPLAHREDVGFASAMVRDTNADASSRVRAYELFATSFPERARGLNRMGFIREAVGLGPGGIQWTAHFGALSSSPERSRREVRLDADESRQRYTVMDGFTDGEHSANTEVRLELEGSWSSPEAFYATVIPAWRDTEPDGRVWSRPQSQVPRMEPLGFLGILQRSLQVAALDVSRQRRPVKVRYPFAHKGELMHLALVDHRIDARRARKLVETGVIQVGTELHRLDYRIRDRNHDEVQRFRVWTQLTGEDSLPDPPVIVPIAFEFKAKSFLRLHATRVDSIY